VQRCVGEGPKQVVVDFPVFGVKILAGTGQLDDQILDRTFPVELRRKRRDEPVQRFTRRAALRETPELRARIAAWMDAHAEQLRDARPALPDTLDDRGQDIAEPLLAIADLAGAQWPTRAREACVALRGDGDELEEDVGVELLADIKKAFGVDERLATEDLLDKLTADPERPWATWSKGSPMSARQLARKVKSFGVKPTQLKIAGVNRRGYERAAFDDAFSRYAPSEAPRCATPATSGQPSQRQAEPIRYPEGAGSGSDNGANPHGYWDVAPAANKSPVPGETQEHGDLAGQPDGPPEPPSFPPDAPAWEFAYWARRGFPYCEAHVRLTTVERVSHGISYLACGCSRVSDRDGAAG
jgi:Protein of unknown function (DUF3631)